MAASTSGAIKAHLEAQGLGIPVFRDRVPPGQELPYITVSEALSVLPDAAFNAFDDEEGHVIERAQVDYWQTWRDSNREMVESYSRPDQIAKALRGAQLPSAPNHVSGMVLESQARLVEVAENVVHHAYTVSIRRVLERI